jgi:O-succinylbenzoate synthase
MHLSEIKIFRYDLPLVKPLPFKGGDLTHREGVLVRLTDADGREGWGEIAPLPHFSLESLVEAQRQAMTLALRPRDFWNSFSFMEVLPSVRFGFEVALLNLNRAWQIRHPNVYLNALLIGSPEECVSKAEEIVAKGYRAAKLKVGHRAVEEDAALVQQVQQKLGEACTLRLDANRAWTFDEAMKFAELVQGTPIEYIEEPLQNLMQLPEWTQKSGIALALDESLRDKSLEKAPALSMLNDISDVYILKPMLDGNSVAKYASSAKKLILSSSVESGIGTLALLKYAAFLNKSAFPIGLDTYNWLAEDVIFPRLNLSQAAVNMEDITHQEYKIQYDILTEIV